jgi:murein DD-endopeptidase MepM/ murein hydrolase activator NlpD
MPERTEPRPSIWRRAACEVAKLKPVLEHLRKGFSLIVTPHGTGTTVTFDLPASVGLVILVLVVVFFVGIGFVGVTYTRLAVLAVEATNLRAENEALRGDNQKIGEIQKELVRIETLRHQIETWAGVADRRAGQAGDVGAEVASTNFWPRRYSYAIMKPFYVEVAAFPEGLMLPVDGWISRAFSEGTRRQPGHSGVDIVAPTGTPVRSALDGVVKSAGWDDVYGNLIVVAHGDTLETLYGHNDKMLVREGDPVTKGQVVALAGSTGKSTAPHVHFEIRRNNKPVDPSAFMDSTKD